MNIILKSNKIFYNEGGNYRFKSHHERLRKIKHDHQRLLFNRHNYEYCSFIKYPYCDLKDATYEMTNDPVQFKKRN